MEGIVLKSTGSWYRVQLVENSEIIECRLKGKIRLSSGKSTNPIAVGDHVIIQEDADGKGIIESILPRTNYIIRKATNLSRQTHVIAANLDQAILVASLIYPRVSTGFIDRFFVTAEAYHIPLILVLNKVDLYKEELAEYLTELTESYTKIGYKVLHTSTTSGEGLEELAELINGKTSLLAGFSGVGKSSLVNQLFPGIDLKTSEISNFSQKGKHTTTFAEMHEPQKGTFIIDTPGIKELGVVDFENWEIAHFFPEMKALLPNCKFHNCLHFNEPQCAVIQGVKDGKVSLERYHNYLSILHNEDRTG